MAVKSNNCALCHVPSHLPSLEGSNPHLLISPLHTQDYAYLSMACLNSAKIVCYPKALELSLRRLVRGRGRAQRHADVLGHFQEQCNCTGDTLHLSR